MNCEVCLPLVGEFFDGEVEARLVSEVRSHIASCASCSRYYESLQFSQDVYDKFLDDVKISESAWQGVHRRIQESKVTKRRGPFSGWFDWFVVPSFERAVVALTLGSLVLLGIVTLRLVSRREKEELASSQPTRVETQNRTDEHLPVEQAQANKSKKPRRIAKPLENSFEKRSVVTAEAVAMLDQAAIFSREMESARSELEANNSGTLKTDVARHFEKTRLLLLSLKNTPAPETDTSVNLTYEKTLSRKLADNNSLLRLEMETAGDQSRADLLDRIEPLLIEIANMPDRASRDEVASISRRIERKDVVGLLQSQAF
jgi:Putative zinc-finger